MKNWKQSQSNVIFEGKLKFTSNSAKSLQYTTLKIMIRLWLWML